MIQLFIWLATSLGLGLTAHRLTGRLALGVATLATAFSLLVGLTGEPMHPGALICLVLTGMSAVIAFVVPLRPRTGLIAVGALAAALLLTKINIGIYAVVSIGFAAVMAGRSLARHTPLRWLAAAAFVLVGPVVMASKLNTGWARSYALLVVLSTLALVFVAFPRYADSAAPDDSVLWVRWLALGFAGCLVIVLAIVFALGSSPGAVFDQMVVVPSHQGTILSLPINLNASMTWWSLGAAALAWTWRRLGRGGAFPLSGAPILWDGLLRAVAGVAILLSLGGQSLFNVAPNAPFSLAMPLAWVAAMPSSGDLPHPGGRLARLLLPSLAILYCLDAYPVAGTQLLLGSILLVLCGAVCVADGWAELAAWNRAREPAGLAHERRGLAREPGSLMGTPALAAVAVALAVGTTFQYIVQPLEIDHNGYRGSTPLKVSGATLLRLSPAQDSAIEHVVTLVRKRCRTLISLPGMYSFNLWTGLPTPSPMTGEQPYWRLLSYGQQTSVLRAAESSPGLCAIRNDTLSAAYGGAPASSPLVSYVERDFLPIAQFPPYVVEVRRS